ncbi:MAG: sugar ABC transporter substrate-binding protein [Rhodospirillaceae bacterium]|nr:sugar ABC transporter substrate-binding protein [Rhodospirillaceae bacterium]
MFLLGPPAGAGGGRAPAYAETRLQLVEVITSPERTELLKKLVAGYEQENPGVKVDIVSLSWGEAFEKLVTMVQGGQVPDVVEMPERWLSLYASKGQLESLEPWLAKWEETGQLTDRTLQFGRRVNDTAYMIPYGFYIRALFYNKKLFQQAGIAAPPATMDEFMEDAKKVSAIPGKYGYCLRGSKGGFTGWYMFMAAVNGKGDWFNDDGTSTFNEPGAVKGLQFLLDIYQKGYAPKDSVNWGFNEIVAGFYSGTCAMLDQDPDALIAIAQRMDKGDFAVAPMPLGPSGKAFPTIGYAGWSMFAASQHKEEAWKLIAHLSNAKSNLEWAKFVGVIPTHKGAETDPHFTGESYAGWFTELNDPKYDLTPYPVHLEKLGYFFDVLSVQTAQKALLGQSTAQQLGDEWAKYLTDAQKEYLAKQK